jgi:hypothetical protein
VTTAALVLASIALAVALLTAWVAYLVLGIARRAESRIARHQQEHRSGIEDEGLPRHRAGAPALTGQIPRVDAGGYEVGVDADGEVRRALPPLPPPGQIGPRP